MYTAKFVIHVKFYQIKSHFLLLKDTSTEYLFYKVKLKVIKINASLSMLSYSFSIFSRVLGSVLSLKL